MAAQSDDEDHQEQENRMRQYQQQLPPRARSPSLLSVRDIRQAPASFFQAPPPIHVDPPISKDKIKKKEEKIEKEDRDEHPDEEDDDDDIQIIESDSEPESLLPVKKEEPVEIAEDGGAYDDDEIECLGEQILDRHEIILRKKKKLEKVKKRVQLKKQLTNSSSTTTIPSTSTFPLPTSSNNSNAHLSGGQNVDGTLPSAQPGKTTTRINDTSHESMDDSDIFFEDITAPPQTDGPQPAPLPHNQPTANKPVTYNIINFVYGVSEEEVPSAVTTTETYTMNGVEVRASMIPVAVRRPTQVPPASQPLPTSPPVVESTKEHSVNADDRNKTKAATEPETSQSYPRRHSYQRDSDTSVHEQRSSSKSHKDKSRHRSSSKSRHRSSSKSRHRSSSKSRHHSRSRSRRRSSSRSHHHSRHRHSPSRSRPSSPPRPSREHERSRHPSFPTPQVDDATRRARQNEAYLRINSHRHSITVEPPPPRTSKSHPLFALSNPESALLRLLTSCSQCPDIVIRTRGMGTQHQKEKHNLKYCHVCYDLLSCKGNAWKDHMIQNHAINEGQEMTPCPFPNCPSILNFEGLYTHIGKQHLCPEEQMQTVNSRAPRGGPILIAPAPIRPSRPPPRTQPQASPLVNNNVRSTTDSASHTRVGSQTRGQPRRSHIQPSRPTAPTTSQQPGPAYNNRNPFVQNSLRPTHANHQTQIVQRDQHLPRPRTGPHYQSGRPPPSTIQYRQTHPPPSSYQPGSTHHNQQPSQQHGEQHASRNQPPHPVVNSPFLTPEQTVILDAIFNKKHTIPSREYTVQISVRWGMDIQLINDYFARKDRFWRQNRYNQASHGRREC